MNMSKLEAIRLNSTNWITNIKPEMDQVTLYATGHSTIAQGRIYVALPAGTPITPKLKELHNIM